MQVWSELFSLFDLRVGQVLLTKEDFSIHKRQSTRDTLGCLLQHNIIPIVNENDTVSTKEICIGNNDSLAALVANLIEADASDTFNGSRRISILPILVLILMQSSFLLSPILMKRFVPLQEVRLHPLEREEWQQKLKRLKWRASSGIRTIIASSTRPNVLIDLVKGKQIGTLFLENTSCKEEKTQ